MNKSGFICNTIEMERQKKNKWLDNSNRFEVVKKSFGKKVQILWKFMRLLDYVYASFVFVVLHIKIDYHSRQTDKNEVKIREKRK